MSHCRRAGRASPRRLRRAGVLLHATTALGVIRYAATAGVGAGEVSSLRIATHGRAVELGVVEAPTTAALALVAATAMTAVAYTIAVARGRGIVAEMRSLVGAWVLTQMSLDRTVSIVIARVCTIKFCKPHPPETGRAVEWRGGASVHGNSNRTRTSVQERVENRKYGKEKKLTEETGKGKRQESEEINSDRSVNACEGDV